MNIDEEDIVELSDDNSYYVARKAKYDNTCYYCVVNTKNNEDIKFLYELKNELVEVEDQKTIDKLLKIMFRKSDVLQLLKILKNKIDEKKDN